MSMYPCLECNEKISTKALACPKCGFPIYNHIDDQVKEIEDNNCRIEFTGNELVNLLKMSKAKEVVFNFIEKRVQQGKIIRLTGSEDDTGNSKFKFYFVPYFGAIVADDFSNI